MSTARSYFIRLQNYLEGFFWPDGISCDVDSRPYYVFRRYPTSLKPNQIDDWINIQVRTQSPYINAKYYTFKSVSGVAIWFYTTPLNGLPETALQTQLQDGTHVVKGQAHIYRQVWKAGEMLNCFILDEAEQNSSAIEIPTGNSWAKPNKLTALIKSPIFSAQLAGVCLAVVCLWTAVGHVSLSFQQKSLNNEIEMKQAELGENLAKKERYDTNIALTQSLERWHEEFGFLPQVISVVISSVLETNEWSAREVLWQNRKLNIELSAPDLNITELVTTLENLELFSQVSIRPNSTAQSWNLELEVKR